MMERTHGNKEKEWGNRTNEQVSRIGWVNKNSEQPLCEMRTKTFCLSLDMVNRVVIQDQGLMAFVGDHIYRWWANKATRRTTKLWKSIINKYYWSWSRLKSTYVLNACKWWKICFSWGQNILSLRHTSKQQDNINCSYAELQLQGWAVLL